MNLGFVLRWFWVWVSRLVRIAAILVLLGMNVRLYAPPDRSGVPAQLTFLRGALENGAGEAMQGLFPEGYFFLHALYGLAWVNQGLQNPAEREAAQSEALWTLDRLDSPAGRAPFSPYSSPPYGVFYVGWQSWLRGGLIKLMGTRADAALITRYEADCTALASAFAASSTPFLSAYPGQAWPVDNVVAIAALRLHDSLLPPRFSDSIERWEQAARLRLDPATGLLPHRVDPVTGTLLDGARGSSQSIIARFLPEIDPEWAQEQYAAFRRQFTATFLGVPAVREYPDGHGGLGDVDSGPLIGGITASATVVMLGAARLYQDTPYSDAVLQGIEAIGLPVAIGGAKRYALGLMPIGDAFLAWANSTPAQPWTDTPLTAPSLSPIASENWRLPLHAFSAAVVALIVVPSILNIRRRTRYTLPKRA